ncbi:MAG: hypothetical protein D6770_05660 [Anaerolineae bacterium]|nr:MAG: hypothetical protein D6770_05660 [Anaerolineae bacterium]
MKRSRWFEIALVVVVLAVHLYAATSEAHNFPNRWFTRDDAYYYFKVAQNITEGRGVTFDGINRANGFHPLWMLICIPIFALARFDLILPLRVLLMVMGALSAATGVLLYRLVSRALSEAVGMLVAATWVFSLYVHATIYQLGLESGIAAFALVYLLYRMERFERRWRSEPVTWRDLASLGAAATLVLFSRLDTVFLVLVLGPWLVFRERPLRGLLVGDMLLLVASALGNTAWRFGLPNYYRYAEAGLWLLTLALVTRVPLYYFAGLYDHPGARPPLEMAKRLFLVNTLATAILSALMLALWKGGVLSGFSRGALLGDWVASTLLVAAWRLGTRALLRSGAHPEMRPAEELRRWWKTWLAEGSAYYGVLGFSLGAYMLWSKLAIGTFTPLSGQIKRWWGSLPARVYGGPARNFAAFFGIDAEGDFNAWAPLTTRLGEWNASLRWPRMDYDLRYLALLGLVLAACLGVLLLNRRRAVRAGVHLSLLPLFVGSMLHVLSYNATGYASVKEWYWVSELLCLLLTAALLADLLLHPLRRGPIGRALLLGAALLLSASMGWKFTRAIVTRMPHTPLTAEKPLLDAAAFLEAHTEPGTLIGMTGGGNVGYYIHERTIVNMDGLINSVTYFEALKRGEAGEYLEAIGLDYVFANPEILQGAPYRGQFTDRLEPIAPYEGSRKFLMRFLPAGGASP